MPASFESGAFRREGAWHGLGIVVDEFPEDIDKCMKLVGHDFEVVEFQPYAEMPMSTGNAGMEGIKLDETIMQPLDGWKVIAKHREGEPDKVLHVSKKSLAVIPNRVGWEIVEAIVGQGAKIETAGVLDEGALCWVLAWLDEPVTIKGDDSPILPFLCVSWAHDGTMALKARSTSIRVVCKNTESLSEMEGKRLGTDFTFRHTKNWRERIDQAKEAISGARSGFAEFYRLSEELAEIKVTPDQRELFVCNFHPMPPEAAISDTVKRNVENARQSVRNLFDSPTIPEAHRLTAYGLNLAGVEWLDHFRGARDNTTRFGRSLLREEPAKRKLAALIRNCIKADPSARILSEVATGDPE